MAAAMGPPAPLAAAGGTPRPAGGVHTMRNIETAIWAKVDANRIELERQIDVVARGCADAAFCRMEALVVPAVTSLRQFVDAELPSLRKDGATQVTAVRGEVVALGTELRGELQQLRQDVMRLREDLSEVSATARRNAQAVVSLDAARGELSMATQSMRAGIEEASGKLNARIAALTEASSEALEAKWAGPMQLRLKAVEAALRETAERSRREAAACVDTVNLVESHLVGRIDDVKTQAFEEARRSAAEVLSTFKGEVLHGKIVEQFQRRLDDSQVLVESRLSAIADQLHSRIAESAASTAAAADRGAADKVAELSTNLTEVVEATRQEVAEQARSQASLAEGLRAELRDTRRCVEAADALAQRALEQQRERCRGLSGETVSLREELSQVRRSVSDGIASVRSELKERAIQWRAFEMTLTGTSLEYGAELAGSRKLAGLRTALVADAAACAGRRGADEGISATLGLRTDFVPAPPASSKVGDPLGASSSSPPLDATGSTVALSEGLLPSSAAVSPLPPLGLSPAASAVRRQ